MSIQYLYESNFKEVETITEEINGTKNWYISGPFMQADIVNKNRRIYPKAIMEREIESYNRNYVKTRRAVGELSHPETPKINLDKISHIIEEIRQDGNNFYGKAKILSTPCGNIAKSLLEGGVQLGVSSRGAGDVRKNSSGIMEVQDNFSLSAVDIVYQPSAPDAFVSGLMEGCEWGTIHEDIEFIENLRNSLDKNRLFEDQEAKVNAFEKFIKKFIKG